MIQRLLIKSTACCLVAVISFGGLFLVQSLFFPSAPLAFVVPAGEMLLALWLGLTGVNITISILAATKSGHRTATGRSPVRFLTAFRWLLGKKSRKLVELSAADLERDRKAMLKEGQPAWYVRLCTLVGVLRCIIPLSIHPVRALFRKLPGIAKLKLVWQIFRKD